MGNLTFEVHDTQGIKFGAAGLSETFLSWLDGQRAGVPGILESEGIIPLPAKPGQADRRDAQHNAHATLGGYEILGIEPIFGQRVVETCVAADFAFCDVEEYATAAGYMDGQSINAISVNGWGIRARKTGGTETGVIELRVFHRPVGGPDSLISGPHETGNLTTSFQDFTGSWSTSSNVAFDTDELLVMKLRGENQGTPP